MRVFEAATPCGYANVTLNGESLEQDDLGVGSGSITTDNGAVLAADWKFTCVHLGRGSQVQSLSVHVVSADGQPVDKTAFSVQFRQTAPVSISYLDGVRARLASSLAPDSLDNPRPSLEDELVELEVLKKQLVALENSIALKITHISDSFNLDRPERLLEVSNCDGLKCFFSTLYDRVKAAASKLYHDSQEKQESRTGRPGNFQWSSNGGQHPLAEVDGVEHPDGTPSPKETGRVSSQDKTDDLISMAEKGDAYSRPPAPMIIDGPVSSIH